MTKIQYKQLKKLINKLEDDALKKGVDITSSEFGLLIERLLKLKDFTLAEYQGAEDEYSDKAIPKGISAFKGEKGDTIKGDKGDKPTKEELLKLIKPLIPVVKDGKDGKTIVGPQGPPGKIIFRGKRGEKGDKGDSINPGIIEKIQREVKVSKDFMAGFDGNIKGKVTELVSPELNRIVRSFQSQIYVANKRVDDLSGEIKAENIWDRTDGVIIPHTADDFIDLKNYHIEVPDPEHDYDAVNYKTLYDAIPSGLGWYLSNDASADVSGYKLLDTNNDADQSTITANGTAASQTLDEWVTLVGTPGDISITEGDISAHVYAKVARADSTDFLYQLKIQFYKRASGGTETQLGEDVTTLPVLTATTTLYYAHAHLTEPQTLAVGDRIVIKISTVRTGSAPRTTAQIVTFYIGDVTPSHINIPVTLAILGKYLPLAGGTMTGTLAMGANNITSTGSLGATGAGKLAKGWFTNLESTNDITINGTALATIYAAIGQTMYIGTTGVAINRASAALTLAGITLTTPDIGTPSAGTLTNCTFPTLNQNTSGTAANLSGTPDLPNGTTATTQSAADNSTKLATTVYADTAAGGGGATVALDNLAGVAINLSLTSDTDITDDLGTGDIRWKDIHAATLNSGLTATDTLKLRGRDVDGSAYIDVLTITSANTVTADLNVITTIGGKAILDTDHTALQNVHGLAITAGQTLTVTTGGTIGSAAYTASTDYAAALGADDNYVTDTEKAALHAAGSDDTFTVADESADTSCFPLFVTAATGDLGAKTGTNLTFNSDTGLLTATLLAGNLTGDVTGNVSGSAGTVANATFTTALIVDTGTLTLTANAANNSVLTIGAGAVSVSGANTGDQSLAGYALVDQTMYIGTTAVAINRGTGALTLAGITLTTPDCGTPSAIVLTNASGTVTNLTLVTPAIGTPSAGVLTSCTGLPAAAVVAGSLVANMEASDHGTAATDMLVNVCYGTGDPPAANTTTEGALFVKYTA